MPFSILPFYLARIPPLEGLPLQDICRSILINPKNIRTIFEYRQPTSFVLVKFCFSFSFLFLLLSSRSRSFLYSFTETLLKQFYRGFIPNFGFRVQTKESMSNCYAISPKRPNLHRICESITSKVKVYIFAEPEMKGEGLLCLLNHESQRGGQKTQTFLVMSLLNQ